MTDRVKGFLVTLTHDLRDEEEGAEVVAQALRMIRGVADVTSIPTDVDDYMARDRVRWEVEQKLRDAIRGVLRPGSS